MPNNLGTQIARTFDWVVCKAAGITFDTFQYFNKKNPNSAKLLPEINQCISILKKNGTLKKIYTKWQLQNPLQAQIGVM